MPTPMFYDGQLGPEIRTKLNELGDLFQAGVDGLLSLQGWSPVLSVVADGSSRQVLRIVDWVGGDGDKPTTLGYVGASGIVADAASAVNVKGGVGNPGPANSLAIGTVVEGPTAAATITGSAPSQVLNLTLPKASDGQDGWSPTFAVATDGARNVLQVVDWVGGSGVKPAIGKYVGAAGLVTLIAEAVDIRGLKGDEGDAGPANSLSIGTVVSGASASATVSGAAPTQVLNLVLQKGDSGSNGWSPVLAGATDGERRVLEAVDWVGGQGVKPANLGYIGVAGIVMNIAQAVDIRGPSGAGTGNVNPTGTIAANDLAAFADSTGNVIKALKAADLPVSTATQTALDGKAPFPEALLDGKTYGRKDAAWAEVVAGPAGSVDNEVALFDGITGKLIKGGSVLNTGAYAEEDRWKLQAFWVVAMTPGPTVPSWALGSYYSQSDQVVANGNTAIRGSTGDIYTMTAGVWVLTDSFGASPNGSRIAYAQTGDIGPFLWTRSAGVTTRTLMKQGSGNIRYSEGTAGVDFANYTVRTKLDEIGQLINLTTAGKASIVAAINELVSTKLGDAPSDGKTYGRKDAAWAEVVSSGGDVTLTGTQTLTNKTIHGNVNTLTVDGTNEVGFRRIPQNSQSAAYTLTLDDAGKHILHPAADTTARTFTIPANASVPYPIGTAITFINQNGTSGVISIAITAGTMRLAGAGTTGSRTLARNGVATAVKITSTEWIISGTGLT